jgi:hypothetical protein
MIGTIYVLVAVIIIGIVHRVTSSLSVTFIVFSVFALLSFFVEKIEKKMNGKR